MKNPTKALENAPAYSRRAGTEKVGCAWNVTQNTTASARLVSGPTTEMRKPSSGRADVPEYAVAAPERHRELGHVLASGARDERVRDLVQEDGREQQQHERERHEVDLGAEVRGEPLHRRREQDREDRRGEEPGRCEDHRCADDPADHPALRARPAGAGVRVLEVRVRPPWKPMRSAGTARRRRAAGGTDRGASGGVVLHEVDGVARDEPRQERDVDELERRRPAQARRWAHRDDRLDAQRRGPAARAEAMPAGESSIATQRVTSTPRRCAARR